MSIELDQSHALRHVAARLGSTWANTHPVMRLNPNATATTSLALAYVQRAGSAKLAASEMYLPYLLAAKQYDEQTGNRLDWSNLDSHFSDAAMADAREVADNLIWNGWQPVEEPDLKGDVTWPWTIAPTVVKTVVVRTRIDRCGRTFWVYESDVEVCVDCDLLGCQEEHGLVGEYLVDDREFVVMSSDPNITVRRMPEFRTWMDEHGRPRWLDFFGREHWIDAHGAEHWVDYSGTEWILLPPE